jgi:hypothetical protein
MKPEANMVIVHQSGIQSNILNLRRYSLVSVGCSENLRNSSTLYLYRPILLFTAYRNLLRSAARIHCSRMMRAGQNVNICALVIRL